MPAQCWLYSAKYSHIKLSNAAFHARVGHYDAGRDPASHCGPLISEAGEAVNKALVWKRIEHSGVALVDSGCSERCPAGDCPALLDSILSKTFTNKGVCVVHDMYVRT